ncbi:hypothetical protein H3T83_01250 [Gilliamella sp. M0320]|uniref:hypothetical protein n=1 Tax=Gilliamella sp. M0320 TaxID=2750965 RepID=UPI0018DC0535|nr:hypothetical protein [Gilliamella sp. M0320]MBI0059820.1 hypothetical protein [Gilliamella sp. M0320]
MVFILTVVVLQSISFSNYALTTKTTNIIYGSAPYLTFDGGRTRVTNTAALLGISLSDGRTFTPTTTNSSDNPIILPVIGQSFNDIGMLVPTNTDSIALSSLIGTPYNYWGDDDGDGQGIDGITATGSLNLSIVDKNNRAVARNEVLTICKAPYKLTLSNDGGRLTTRYGVPNESRFTAGNATYYINPKAAPVICYARPSLVEIYGSKQEGLSAAVWNPDKGFLTQSVTPSSYDLNFPTTGANNVYFDLDIGGNNQALSWAPVSHGGITATMTDSTSTSVRVTLTGPFSTRSQWFLRNPGEIAKPSLPQVFELVGRDSSGNAVVKYGFKLKQWFVNRGDYEAWSGATRWCTNIGYRIPKVLELTNASCRGRNSGSWCQGAVGATPSSPDNYFRRHIGGGLFSEWGWLGRDSNFFIAGGGYRTADRNNNPTTSVDKYFSVEADGPVWGASTPPLEVCVYP